VLSDDLQWFDTGTHDSLLHASNEVARYQKETGHYVGCLEEVAYRQGFIDRDQLRVCRQWLTKGLAPGRACTHAYDNAWR